MTRINIDEAALQRAAGDAVKKSVAKIDRDMDGHRGKTAEEVKPALEESMRRHGIQPDVNSKDFTRTVEVISSGGHLR